MDSINDIDMPETEPVPETEAAPQAAAAPVAKEKKPRKSKKKSVLTIVLLLVFFLIIAPVGTYFGTYLMAVKNAKDGNFETAGKLLLVKPLTDKHDNVLLIYIDAGKLMNSGNYNEAALKFYSISSYEDSLKLAKECSEKHADKLVGNDNFNEELDWGYQVSGYDTELGKKIELNARYHLAASELAGYRDYSSDRILAISNELQAVYEQGCEEAFDSYVESRAVVALYYAYMGNYRKASDIIETVKDYNDKTKSLYEDVARMIFKEGENLYYDGDFEAAAEYFDMVSEYSNAASYRAVCNNLNLASVSTDYESYLKEAFEYYDVPDVGYVIFKNSKVADKYFFGEWKSGTFYYRLEQGQNGKGNTFYTNIPMIDFNSNDSFYYKENVFCAGTSYAEANRPCFTFYVNSYYEMSIYCEKNGQTYHLCRQ